MGLLGIAVFVGFLGVFFLNVEIVVAEFLVYFMFCLIRFLKSSQVKSRAC